jgi:hypothetical protein
MKLRRFFATLMVFSIVSVAAIPALAQTTGPGPYYATPSWDQKLQCDTKATCPRFLVLSNWDNAAVLDRETGLVWERSPSTSTFNWGNAQLHCKQLTISNRMGWRLAALQELESLIDRSQSSPALPAGHPFNNVSAAYWSASNNASADNSAWGLFIDDGTVAGDPGNKSPSSFGFAWCVRGGPGVDPQ